MDITADRTNDSDTAQLSVVPNKTREALHESVRDAMQRYFDDLQGELPTDLYERVLSQVEAPLLAALLEHVNGNQSLAARTLGLSRSTLRKKLKQYGML